MEVDSTEQEGQVFAKLDPPASLKGKEEGSTAPQHLQKHAEQSGPMMSHAPSIGNMMNPKDTWKDERPSHSPQNIREAVSRIMGVEVSDWPYNRESFESLLSLKVQQETVKAEQARAKDLELSLKLLEQAHTIGIPADLIPYLFLVSRTETDSIRKLMTKWGEEHPHYINRSQSSPARVSSGQSRRSGLGIRTQHGSNQDSMSQAQSKPKVPKSTPERVPGRIPEPILEHTPTSGVASVPVRQTLSHQEGSGARRQHYYERQSSASPFRPSHQRSHTISGMVGTTSVWKVNLPQQQQFQFHHWSGPGGNEDDTSHSDTRKSKFGHSRTSSRNATKVQEDTSLDSAADVSLVSESASPSSSTKRKLDPANEQEESAYGGTEAVFSLQPRRGLHSRGESITLTGRTNSINSTGPMNAANPGRSPGHKRSRSDVTGFPAPISGQYQGGTLMPGAASGPYMYRYPQYNQPPGGPYYNQRYPGQISPQPGIYYGSQPHQGPYYYQPQLQAQQQPQQQRPFRSYRFPPNAGTQSAQGSIGEPHFVFSNQRNATGKTVNRESASSSSTNATTLSMSSARRTSVATSKDTGKKN